MKRTIAKQEVSSKERTEKRERVSSVQFKESQGSWPELIEKESFADLCRMLHALSLAYVMSSSESSKQLLLLQVLARDTDSIPRHWPRAEAALGKAFAEYILQVCVGPVGGPPWISCLLFSLMINIM